VPLGRNTVVLRAYDAASNHAQLERTVDRREVVNAILYVLRTGCRWGDLPAG
jgi:transposase